MINGLYLYSTFLPYRTKCFTIFAAHSHKHSQTLMPAELPWGAARFLLEQDLGPPTQ